MEVNVKDLTVNVSGQDKTVKTLLDNLSFCVAPGEVVALMGPSGAGKTTLLNRVAGRGFKGEVTGDISYNGVSLRQSITEKSSSNSIGYVTQDDIMYESLTPKENLLFTAQFLQGAATAAEQQKSVDEVLEKLRLVKCKDTVVGIPGLIKGISGGERKRTNVGMSLLLRPSLLLLDEPTSGLDSKMAEELMKDMSDVATNGCTIIATIHQPSEAVFEHFSKVLLLESGRIAYFGPVDGLRAKIGGLGFDVQKGKPLPEILLEVLEAPSQDSPDAEKQQYAQRVDKLRSLSESSMPGAGGAKSAGEAGKVTRLGFCKQVSVLFRRNFLVLRRSKTLTLVRFGQTLMSTLLIGWIFAQLDKDMKSIRPRMFALFLLIFASFMFALLGVINTFPSERPVFLREAQDRWYHPAAFYISKVLTDTILQCGFPLIVLIGYAIVGLNTESFDRVLTFYLVVAMTSNIGSAMGFIVSALVSDVSTALSVAPGLMMPQMLLCGLFIPVDSLPQPFRSLSFLAVVRYMLQGAIINEFVCDPKPACPPTLKVDPQRTKCGVTPCDYCCTENDLQTFAGICPVLTCEEALQSLGFLENMWPTDDSLSQVVTYNLLLMFGFLLLIRIQGLSALMLSYRRAVKSS